ncbi:MAG: formylglycine-generating enzyme family protein, partial [Candidatus Sumerlaeota bacterium]|nr:formylglycine-generating enzyme family protein [Candidatus Sumerlaeota bacterium]
MAVCVPAAYRVSEISARVEHWRQEDHKRAQEKKQAEAAVEAYAASERKWAKLKEDEAAEAARLAEEDEAERLFQCVFYDEAVDDEAVDQASATITRKRKKIFIAVSLMIAIGAGAMFYAWGAHKEQRLEAAKIAFAQLQYEDTRDTRDIRDTSNLQPRQRIIMWQEYLKKFGDTEYKTFHTIDRIKELENLAPRWEAAEKAFTAVALLDQSATATKEQKAQAWADFLRQHENSGYGKIPEARTKATDWNKKIALEKAEPAFNTALALEQSATATKEQKAQAWVTALAVCRAAEHRVREAEARLARWKVEVEQAPYSEQAGCGLNLEMVWIPPGAFDMGSPDSENGRSSGEGPVHRVTLDGFLLGKTEVTQAQYEKIAGTNPSSFKGDGNLPVENVSWNDAVSFCKKLSGKSGRTFTLPTEAQWEYACRAGSSTQFCFGGSNSGFGDYAWFNGNSGGNTHPVRTKQANAFGLCDMHGNVWEWCRDWYDEGFYKMSGATARNPENTTEAAYRVLRGGGWFSSPQYCRSADRLRYEPGYSFDDLGFRVAAFPAAGQ